MTIAGHVDQRPTIGFEVFFSDSFSSIFEANRHGASPSPPWAQLFGLHRHIDPNLEATTEIENAKKRHEKVSKFNIVWMKKNCPLRNSSLFEINHTRKSRSLCWMRLFDSTRPSSHH
jgi:hypothetical protein